MSADRYLPAARYAAWAITSLLVERGLKPLISRIVLTETQEGNAWLFAVLEVSASDHPEAYTAPDLVSDLTAALQGLPLVVSESYGMRYAVLLGSQNLA